LPRSAFDRDQIAGHGDHVRSGTSLITIIYIAGHSHLLYKLQLTADRAFGNSD